MAKADADQPKTRLQHRLKGSQEEEIQQRHSTTNAIINS